MLLLGMAILNPPKSLNPESVICNLLHETAVRTYIFFRQNLLKMWQTLTKKSIILFFPLLNLFFLIKHPKKSYWLESAIHYAKIRGLIRFFWRICLRIWFRPPKRRIAIPSYYVEIYFKSHQTLSIFGLKSITDLQRLS